MTGRRRPAQLLARGYATLRGSVEAGRSVWSTVGLVGSSIAAAATVIIAARQLGTARYGLYAGIGALVGLAALFGAMGTKEVLLQRVTRDPAELPAAWGVLLAANVVIGVPLLALTALAGALLLPGRDLTSIILIAVAEYVSAGLIKGPAYAWVALDRFPVVATINIADAVLRLAAAASLLCFGPEVRNLAWALAIAMSAGAVGVNVALARTAGRPRLVGGELLAGCRTGAPFSVATISTGVQSNIDQFMLVRARLDVDAGLYAAGVRFMAYSMLPLHAMMSASVPEFFRIGGSEGLADSLRYGRRLVTPVVVISTAGAAAAIALSKPLGALFGDRFDGVFPVVAAMALFPLVRTMQSVFANALLGSGHQRFVARIQTMTAALNVAVNLVLIPWWGWKGAVVATYVSELATLSMLATGARRRSEREAPVTRLDGSSPG